MSKFKLPYNGGSTPRKYQQHLSDDKLDLINDLYDMSLQINEQETDKPIVNNLKYRDQDKDRHQAVNFESLSHDFSKLKVNMNPPKAMAKFREKLPCFRERSNILKNIFENQVVVISGETGCGKTTQVPQYILEDALSSGHGVSVVCTQPRRVAAITVAERVAQETGTRLGDVVGYQVRHDSVPPRSMSSIMYCTTGVLVQRLQSDKMLNQFTHVIVDEIHERDVMADILLVMLKKILPIRPKLKLILMSATLNAERFSEYMDKCVTLHIPGFMFPVHDFYLEDVLQKTKFSFESHSSVNDHNNNAHELSISKEEALLLVKEKGLSRQVLTNFLHPLSECLNLDLIAETVKYIHENKPQGAILAFVPGWEEITMVTNMLLCLENAVLLPLHGSMSGPDQRKIFQPLQPGVRKIVISTNIAESSVTINDIVYVVDCGMAKMKKYDAENNADRLHVDWISKANSKQRKGRAGRLRNGEVYKLYSKQKENSFLDFMVPEIVRCRLENIILKIKVLGHDDINGFFQQMMDIPDDQTVAFAHQTLMDIGALSDDGKLTALGATLGQIPADPRLGKMMILGAAFSCIDPILSVVTYLEYKSPFVATGKIKELNSVIDNLSGDTMSDHLTIANVMAAWDGLNAKGGQAKVTAVQEFAYDNFLSQGIMIVMDKMKKQYASELHKIGLMKSTNPKDPMTNRFSGSEAVVRTVICLGLLPNILTLSSDEDETLRMKGVNCQELAFHPRSCNRNVLKSFTSQNIFAQNTPRLFAYYEKLDSNCVYISDSTAASPFLLNLLASNILIEPHIGPSSDQSIDIATKKHLGILFHDNEATVCEILLKSGSNKTRILLCDSETARKIDCVRKCVNTIIQRKFCNYFQSRKSEDMFMKLIYTIVQESKA